MELSEPILSYAGGTENAQQDDAVLETVDTPDSRFDINFITALKLLVHPQSLRDKLNMTEIAESYLALHEMWLQSELIGDNSCLRNFARFVCSKPPYQLSELDEQQLEDIYARIMLQITTVISYIENVEEQIFNEVVAQLAGGQVRRPLEELTLMAELAMSTRYLIFYRMKTDSIITRRSMHCLPDEINYGKFSCKDNRGLTAAQRIQLYMLKLLRDCQFRKFGSEVYKEIITEHIVVVDENGVEYDSGQFHTHAWERHMDIDKFVGSAVRKDENFEAWKNLTRGTSINPIVEKLTSLSDVDFPEVKKDRHFFSFSDGVYDAKWDDFYIYAYKTPDDVRAKVEQLNQVRQEMDNLLKKATKFKLNQKRMAELRASQETLHKETRLRGSDLLTSDLATARFINQDFIPAEFEGNWAVYASECNRWDSIPLPSIDRILDHQKFYDTILAPARCSAFRCGKMARFASKGDSQPRWCQQHQTEDMVDKLTVHCVEAECAQVATHWHSFEQARQSGQERQKFCAQHAPEGAELIPQEIQTGGSAKDNLTTDKSTKFMFYALCGRLFYNVGELDSFQVIPFLKGLANTGKSTVVKVVQSCYAPQDVQVLSNNIEKRFGLEPMMEKFMFVAPEIKDNFGLDQAEFQSMVSGDPMSISRKFKTAQTLTWIVPGILAGNEPPKWVDKAGSIARRVVTFPFTVPVHVVDPTLEAEALKELPFFIRRCNLAYHALIDFLAKPEQDNKSIWSIMPEKLLTARKQLTLNTSALGDFLKENTEIVVAEGPDRMKQWVPWDFFLEKLHAFNLKRHLPPLKNVDPREFNETFASMKVDLVFDETTKGVSRQRAWSGNANGGEIMHRGPFLYGMTYRPAPQE
jgi:hypothetical protein